MKVLRFFVREIIAVMALVCVSILCAPMAHAQSPVTSNFLRLTPNMDSQVSSAWYTNPSDGVVYPVPLVNGFSTTFTFQISHPGGIGPADGIVFVVQNGTFQYDSHGVNCANGGSGASAIAATVCSGGDLGYSGLTSSVAVQFDTYYNSQNGDISASPPYTSPTAIPYSSTDEISVQSCGANPNTSAHTGSEYAGETACTFGVVDLSTLASPIYIADGNTHTATITYTPPLSPTSPSTCYPGSPGFTPNSGPCGSLTVTLDSAGTVLTVPFDLGYLGLDANDDAYPGFTAATGGGNEDQDIESWSFTLNDPALFSYPVFPTSAATGLQINGNAFFVQIVTSTVADLAATPVVDSNFSATVTNPTTGAAETATKNFILDYTAFSGDISYGPLAPPIQFQTVSSPLTNSTIGPYVIGTWAATALPLPKTVDTAANNGIAAGAKYDVLCSDANHPPAEGQCPSVSSNPEAYITASDVFDQPLSDGFSSIPKPSPAPGTTIALIWCHDAVNCWQPNDITTVIVGGAAGNQNAACSNPFATATSPQTYPVYCPLQNIYGTIYGDQTTTSSKGKPPNPSSFGSFYNVFTPLTTVSGMGTTNSITHNGNFVQLNSPPQTSFLPPLVWFSELQPGQSVASVPLNLMFFVNPACPSPLNRYPCPSSWVAPYYFLAAPIASEAYDVLPSSATPPILANLTPLPTPSIPTGPPATPVTFPTVTLPTILADGYYDVYFSADDSVGNFENNVQLITGTTCPNPTGGAPFSPPCYETSLFYAPFGVDSTPPAITGPTLSPGGPTYTVPPLSVTPTTVTITYSCNDGAGSGVASCMGQISPATLAWLTPPLCTLSANGEVDTCTASFQATSANVGSYTFTVSSTDNVGNSVPAPLPSVSFSISYASASVLTGSLFLGGAQGSNLTYLAGAVDTSPTSNPTSVYGATITVTFTIPTNTLASGNATAGFWDINCAPPNFPGCLLPPKTTSPCSVSPSGVSGSTTSLKASCAVGNLADAATSKTGVGVIVVMPISAKAPAGTITSNEVITAASPLTGITSSAASVRIK